nr:helix-turn-helix domain-containing protein [Nonomuraea pusilla]
MPCPKLGVREIARRLGRSPSTISRELRRNASTRTYATRTARRWRGRRQRPGRDGTNPTVRTAAGRHRGAPRGSGPLGG